LFKSGLFDTTPLDNFIAENLNITSLRNSGRHLKVGATCLDTGSFSTFKNLGKFEIFNETSKDIHKAVLASAAVPGVFPLVKINGKDYVDGGAVYLTPIKSALVKCEELGYDRMEIDAILAIGDSELPGWVDKLLSTPFILLRTIFASIANIFLKDVENARHAFPHASIRVIKPSKWLPGYFLGFGHTKEMMEQGYKDAMEIINKP
jgi:predicted acylesterase/phospholipase RssA